MVERKGLPIGIDNFKMLIDHNYYFVDKTPMIKDLIDNIGKANLFTRPRRFGKTLNISMIQYYFEKTDKDNSHLFDGLAIMDMGEKYTSCQGQYPVISLSLKSMKQPNFEYAFTVFRNMVRDEFWRHKDVFSDSRIAVEIKTIFEQICSGKAPDSVYPTALRILSDCLSKVYEKNIIILIDEYDVPLENAYFEGFYDDMVKLIRSVFESALKTNPNLEFAVLTGCLRVSKESIFTGLNNLDVYSVTDENYAECFGFTEKEIADFTNYYGFSDKLPEMKKWYDGYRFGNTEIYNPWSILKYMQAIISGRSISAEAYWSNTSSNNIIHELIAKSDKNIRDDIEKLINGESIDKPLYQDITYADINVRSDCIWSFLLYTGYLKPISTYKFGDDCYFKAVLPNTEVKTIYVRTFRKWFNENIRVADKSTFFNAVINGDAETFAIEVNRWLTKSISYHDGYENFYHGFLVGLLQCSDDYLVESNRESGTGRNDIVVRDVITYKKAVIIELKTVKDGETLVGQCDAALKQIEDKNYQANLEYEGYTDFLKYGIAFMGKRCMVKKA